MLGYRMTCARVKCSPLCRRVLSIHQGRDRAKGRPAPGPDVGCGLDFEYEVGAQLLCVLYSGHRLKP